MKTYENHRFRARKTRNNRERIKAKAEKKQRKNKETRRIELPTFADKLDKLDTLKKARRKVGVK